MSVTPVDRLLQIERLKAVMCGIEHQASRAYWSSGGAAERVEAIERQLGTCASVLSELADQYSHSTLACLPGQIEEGGVCVWPVLE